MNAEFLAVASKELAEAIRYYEDQQPGLGRAFGLEARRTADRIARFPSAHAILFDEVRRCYLRRFPYKIIYQLRKDKILVLAVAHNRRHPTYWRTRLSAG